MTAWPMTPTEYARNLRGIELAAEFHAVQRRIDAGHEFAALMEPGSSVLLAGTWRTVASAEATPDNRLVIRCTDGSEWLANRTATRPYRSADAGVKS